MRYSPAPGLAPRRLHGEAGIALGPILFIVAIVTLLAAVIAAGAGMFNANTSTESDKAMAEVIISSGHAYADALQLMLHNGCVETAIDWTPPSFPAGTAAWTGGDWTNGNPFSPMRAWCRASRRMI